jgi:hypothetical protein
MTLKLIGRKDEQHILEELYTSKNPEFLAMYGRRRVGKTYLLKTFFSRKSCIFFSATGIQKGDITEQIERFMVELSRVFYGGSPLEKPKDWFAVFDVLHNAIEKMVSKKQKVVLLFDEFPWMVTHRSKLLTVIEYFWNQHWSMDSRIKLLVCGSSASWIIKKIINNKGGLHNRITRKIQLSPFCLNESQQFLASQGVRLNKKQVTQIYMVAGGIPYYLKQAQKGLSATQNIDVMAFKKNCLLFKEFDNLFSSLFDDAEPYIEAIKIIAKYRQGIGQEELISESKLISRGGRASARLKELEEAGFILSFTPHFRQRKGIYYKVIDEYTLFYLKWIEPIRNSLQKQSLEDGYWEGESQTPSWLSWSGYAFEAICYKHLSQIRRKLKIKPNAIANSWRFVPKVGAEENGAQIDILFDRKDDAITLCEIKYSEKPFVINKQCARNLMNKEQVFIDKTKTKKQIFTALIVASGVKENLYYDDLVSGVVTLEDLFE